MYTTQWMDGWIDIEIKIQWTFLTIKVDNLITINICIITNTTYSMATRDHSKHLQNSIKNINIFCICYYRLTTEICMLLPMSGYYQCGIMMAGGIIQRTHPVQQKT